MSPRSSLLLGLTLALAPLSASAAAIELTPEGDEICCDPSDYSIRGYRFTVAEPFTAYGIEWWVELPAGAAIAARIYGPGDALLLAGEPTLGDGSEQWYRAEFNYDFAIGETYDVLVYLDAPNEALFRRSSGACCDYAVPPYLTAVESRSSSAEIDGPSTTYNVWPAYMRLVLDAPDSDGDGVADPADACPDSPLGEPVDATGCPEGQATTGPADTGPADTGPAEATGDEPTSAPDPTGGPDASSGGGTGGTGGDAPGPGSASAASDPTTPITTQADQPHGDDGCSCTTAGPRAPWLLLALAAPLRRRRRGR